MTTREEQIVKLEKQFSGLNDNCDICDEAGDKALFDQIRGNAYIQDYIRNRLENRSKKVREKYKDLIGLSPILNSLYHPVVLSNTYEYDAIGRKLGVDQFGFGSGYFCIESRSFTGMIYLAPVGDNLEVSCENFNSGEHSVYQIDHNFKFVGRNNRHVPARLLNAVIYDYMRGVNTSYDVRKGVLKGIHLIGQNVENMLETGVDYKGYEIKNGEYKIPFMFVNKAWGGDITLTVHGVDMSLAVYWRSGGLLLYDKSHPVTKSLRYRNKLRSRNKKFADYALNLVRLYFNESQGSGDLEDTHLLLKYDIGSMVFRDVLKILGEANKAFDYVYSKEICQTLISKNGMPKEAYGLLLGLSKTYLVNDSFRQYADMLNPNDLNETDLDKVLLEHGDRVVFQEGDRLFGIKREEDGSLVYDEFDFDYWVHPVMEKKQFRGSYEDICSDMDGRFVLAVLHVLSMYGTLDIPENGLHVDALKVVRKWCEDDDLAKALDRCYELDDNFIQYADKVFDLKKSRKPNGVVCFRYRNRVFEIKDDVLLELRYGVPMHLEYQDWKDNKWGRVALALVYTLETRKSCNFKIEVIDWISDDHSVNRFQILDRFADKLYEKASQEVRNQMLDSMTCRECVDENPLVHYVYGLRMHRYLWDKDWLDFSNETDIDYFTVTKELYPLYDFGFEFLEMGYAVAYRDGVYEILCDSGESWSFNALEEPSGGICRGVYFMLLYLNNYPRRRYQSNIRGSYVRECNNYTEDPIKVYYDFYTLKTPNIRLKSMKTVQRTNGVDRKATRCHYRRGAQVSGHDRVYGDKVVHVDGFERKGCIVNKDAPNASYEFVKK